jgi:hypothetical protein
MTVHRLKPLSATRSTDGAILPPDYKPPVWVGNRRVMRTMSGIVIGGALVRNHGPAANDEKLTLVKAEMSADAERIQAAMNNPLTARKALRDRVLRLLHILRTEVRARRLLRDAVHEATVKRFVSWL